jgi:hypothetical protein
MRLDKQTICLYFYFTMRCLEIQSGGAAMNSPAIIDKTLQLIAQLHKGGAWGYWWTDHGRESIWWKVGQPAPIPEGWKNVYFGVHPASSKGGQFERSKIPTIAAINCLFAEFDAKDFPGGKSEALNHVTGLEARPSVLVDSGGGYHGYWILQEGLFLETDQDRKRAQAIQAAWVKYTGGDPGAKDLARVLRVPGSLNCKYDPPRPVGFTRADFSLLHNLNELEALSKPQEAPRSAQARNNGRSTTDPGSYWLKQAVLKAHAGSRNETGLWLATQLRDSGLTQGEAESVMLDYTHQAPAGDHPYTESEALASLQSAYSRPPREAATLPSSPGNGQPQASVDLARAPAGELGGADPGDPASGGTWADIAGIIGPITWAWDKWIANGMLHIIASEPGKGKSALCLRLAGCYLLGKPWPDGKQFTAEPGKVLWCEAEAGQAVNLERARLWGLPLDSLLTPLPDPLEDLKLDNATHVRALEAIARRDDVKLIILDSLRGLHSRDENSSEVMSVVHWLAELARDTQKPFILTHHLRKRGIFDIGEAPNLDRLRGSTAITQAARLVWALDTPDPMQEHIARLSVIKSNLAKFPQPVGMTIDEHGVTFTHAPEAPKVESVADKAADLLLALLSDEPMPAGEIEKEFNGHDVSWRSAERAKKRLGIVSVKKDDGRWYWSLPAKDEHVN